MDAVLAIFKQLGVDQTIVTQFAILLFIFMALKTLLFDKLLFVIQTREDKTIKLEGEVTHKLQKAEELSAKYKTRVEEAHTAADKILQEKKQKINEFEKNRIQEEEKKVTAELESKRAQFNAEINNKKKEIFSESDHLSKQLLNKLTK